MPLESSILKGSARLEGVISGGAPVKQKPPGDEADAVRRIQRGLIALGFPLPVSTKNSKSGEPDGVLGGETHRAIVAFQQRFFPGQSTQWHGRVDKPTLEKMDVLLPKGAEKPKEIPAPAGGDFICGPDVTDQVSAVWTQLQKDFRGWTRIQKIRVCNRILIPVKDPLGLIQKVMRGDKRSLDSIMSEIRAHADVDGWDVMPLFQGASGWLRKPPVYDKTTKGPCATPSSAEPDNTNEFAAGHEDDKTCSNTVTVAGKCWLNGSVNYGTFGIMVKECSEFAAGDWRPGVPGLDPFPVPLKFDPVLRPIYSLAWAKTLIRAYKKFGNNPEGAIIPVAWTEATFNKGPGGTPDIPGNRPKCKCNCGCKGDIVTWDYVWEPEKPRDKAKMP